MLRSIFMVLAVLACASADRFYCYSGSSLYQLNNVDCSSKDPSYKGKWYCAKIKICEAHISSRRECIYTRGCAKEEECVDPNTNDPYDGDAIYTANNTKPAGMDIRAYCCSADDFPDDDSIAIDMGKICNAAPGSVQPFKVMIALLSVLILGIAYM